MGPINRLGSGGAGLDARHFNGQGWVYFWSVLRGASAQGTAPNPLHCARGSYAHVLYSHLNTAPWYTCNKSATCGSHLVETFTSSLTFSLPGAGLTGRREAEGTEMGEEDHTAFQRGFQYPQGGGGHAQTATGPRGRRVSFGFCGWGHF